MKTVYYAHDHKLNSGKVPEGRDSVLWGFYPSLFVCRMAHGPARTYYKVEVTPFEGSEEDAPYWAWWNNEKEEFHHVYYAKLMVQMCFPYDLAIYEEQGRGKQMPVTVTIVETFKQDD